MWAPLHLAHRILVADKVRLARATDSGRLPRRGVRAEPDHAAVPDADRLVDPGGREHERAVLVPVEREHLPAGRGHGQRCRRERRGERGAAGRGGRVRGRAQVEELERAVGRARREHVGLVRREQRLVHAGGVRLQRRQRSRPIGRPLRAGQRPPEQSAGVRRGTYELDGPVPGGGDELVFADVGPVDGEDLAGVLLPGTYREVLHALAALGISRTTRSPERGAYLDHDVPQLERSVARRSHELVLVDLRPSDVVQAVLRLVAGPLRNGRAHGQTELTNGRC